MGEARVEQTERFQNNICWNSQIYKHELTNFRRRYRYQKIGNFSNRDKVIDMYITKEKNPTTAFFKGTTLYLHVFQRKQLKR